MVKALVVGVGLGALLVAPAAAHHPVASLGTVTLSDSVTAGGTRLDPGTYEIRLTGKHMDPLPGQSDDAGQEVEFIAGGIVVAREFAEAMPADTQPVGTSGGRESRPRVDRLRGGDFVRVSVRRDGERLLIHLPVAR